MNENCAVCELILVRRILQKIDRFLLACLLLFGRARETKVTEGLLVVEHQPIKERILRIHAMSERDVTELVCQDCRQAGFIGKDVDQAAAENDGVADSERLPASRSSARGSESPAGCRGYW